MEELNSIADSFKNKCILVTGSTGFLAKLFVEKVLRVQPEVKKLYLLLRATDAKTVTQRFRSEVTGKELFRVLKEKHGKGFDSFIAEKVSLVAGDISCVNLGIEETNLVETMWKEVNIIVNSAATTNFYERYDVAMGINVLGAKHVLDFAKKCAQLEILLHVSTAYVAGEKSGVILEKPFQMGETLNQASGLDVDAELRLVEERLKELHADDVEPHLERTSMKQLGLQRARHFGWPNTYVFTKALGEMVLGLHRARLPLVILRPTMITSTLQEPFPGWMEGTRTIDTLIIGYAKEQLTCFLGDLELIMDIVPGDMVANAMMAVAAAHGNHQTETIYHVGTSVSNPVNYAVLLDSGFRYFTENPRVGKDGRQLETHRIPVYSDITSFHRYMILRYRLPLEALRVTNAALCRLFQGTYDDLSRKYKFVMHLVDLYKPYAFFKGCFDDLNLERLRRAVAEEEKAKFCFDPRRIDWEDYLANVHIPGVLKCMRK
ncbi:hypothetical protein QJS10_CPB19g00363 [Acorus calamus]|uniref:Fatty acyl-CoA reductase n=1 Tax=Acorus calamus TaxID=4465 RepID=A0AAV9CKM4_ACOCL|nr:hypothetical protein QJS10_CPB19g00363 [Acorus calamus]